MRSMVDTYSTNKLVGYPKLLPLAICLCFHDQVNKTAKPNRRCHIGYWHPDRFKRNISQPVRWHYQMQEFSSSAVNSSQSVAIEDDRWPVARFVSWRGRTCRLDKCPDTRVTSYDGVICHRGGERHSGPGMDSGGRSVFHGPPPLELQAHAYASDLSEQWRN